jgi:SAM-dependent methyltransferase
MDPLGRKELIALYDRYLKDFGDTEQSVGWTPQGQKKRYETMLRIAGDISGKKVLDFGCGKGDFYGFIRDRGFTVQYCGIEMNQNLVSLAKSKYPNAEFLSFDIEEVEFGEVFDIVFIIGVFNSRVAGIGESMNNVLKKTFALCREALHVNALSYYTPLRDIQLFYIKPEDLLHYAISELSPTVILRHGIIKGDIFLSVY